MDGVGYCLFHNHFLNLVAAAAEVETGGGLTHANALEVEVFSGSVRAENNVLNAGSELVSNRSYFRRNESILVSASLNGYCSTYSAREGNGGGIVFAV